jgi:hypothetical protein
MTPSAYRLLGLIQKRSESDSVYWIRINLSELASSLDLSERTLKRAKAELDGFGLVKFRTISNGEGRGHKLHACLPHKLVGKRGELLHSTAAGKSRISRTKVGGQVIHKPTIKSRPRDTSNTIGSLQEHHNEKPTVRQGLERKPTSKQVALAHWLKRELWKRHSWDNCKVQKSDAHAFGFALRAIKAGFDVDQIHKAFEQALKVMHGTATDFGLNTGRPTQTLFCLSSTVSLAQKTLKMWRINQPENQHWMDIKTMRQRSHACLKADNSLAKNATSNPEMRHDRSPIKPQPCQRARFASIMDALA